MIALHACYPSTLLPTVLRDAQELANQQGRELLVRSMAQTCLVYVAPCELHPVDGLIAKVKPCPRGYTRAWQIDAHGQFYSNMIYMPDP